MTSKEMSLERSKLTKGNTVYIQVDNERLQSFTILWMVVTMEV